MFTWIAENIATIVICVILLGVTAAIIIRQLRNRKKGISSCGCSCGSCPVSGNCHKIK